MGDRVSIHCSSPFVCCPSESWSSCEDFVVCLVGDELLIKEEDKTLEEDLPSIMSDNVRFKVSGFSKSSSLSSSLSLNEPLRKDGFGPDELWDSLSWSTSSCRS